MSKSSAQVEAPAWRNRIVDHAEVDPVALAAHPSNFRRHPKAQQVALAGVIADVGFARSVTVNRRTGFILDGHLRVALAIQQGQASIPVEYVELDPSEERELLATLDPLSAMAETDAAQLDALLREVSTGEAAVQAMLAELARESGLVPDEPTPAKVDEIPEQFMVMVTCADEAQQADLLERLAADGYRCRALVS